MGGYRAFGDGKLRADQPVCQPPADQDRHLLLLSGEYRWLPSRVLDMAIFVDAGKVTADRRDLDFNHLETAYGIGARIHGPTVTPLRIDVARGSEGIRLHITGGLTF